MSANVDDDPAKAEEMIKNLSALIMADEDFRELSKVQEVYCPFEALGVEKAEIRHSNFLKNILSPNSTHGFGEEILRKFCELLLIEAGERVLALDLHLSDLSNVDIRREWRDIDLLIRFPKMCNGQDLIIAIELKVGAKESEGQLEKYEGILEKSWPLAKKILFFVTPDKVKARRESWVSVGFETIVGAIEDSTKEIQGHPSAMMMIRSYISMIRRKYMSNDELEGLTGKIWSKHRKTLEFLIENQPILMDSIIRNLQSDKFLEQINSGLEKKECAARLIYKDRKSKGYIKFSVSEWGHYNDMLKENQRDSEQFIYLEIDIRTSGSSAKIMLGDGDSQRRDNIYNVLRDKDALFGRKKDALSPQTTTLHSTTILHKDDMKIILDQLNEDETENFTQSMEEFKQGIVDYFIEVIPPFHKAVLDAAKDGLIK